MQIPPLTPEQMAQMLQFWQAFAAMQSGYGGAGHTQPPFGATFPFWQQAPNSPTNIFTQMFIPFMQGAQGPQNHDIFSQWAALFSPNSYSSPAPSQSAFGQAFPFAQMSDMFGENMASMHGQYAAYHEGVSACLGMGYAHTPAPRACVWQRGSAKLYDYAPNAADAPAIFIIPSLINQANILDLLPEASFINHLCAQGYRPLLLDWGTPGETELSFNSEDYLHAYAADALAHARNLHDGPIVLMGYCMGGIFALSLAQMAPIAVDGLILIATPWDFASDDTPVVFLNPAAQEMLRQTFAQMNPVPPALIQMIFYSINPMAVFEKFIKFPNLSEEAKARFAAIEHWAQHGVPLSNQVAEECFITWPQENLLKSHRFKMGRKWLEPNLIKAPTLIIAAKRDKIVPIGCATPLAKEIKRASLITPDSGHVGMVAGLRAPELCWHPVTDWLLHRF